jgi:hypothetical protein
MAECSFRVGDIVIGKQDQARSDIRGKLFRVTSLRGIEDDVIVVEPLDRPGDKRELFPHRFALHRKLIKRNLPSWF